MSGPGRPPAPPPRTAALWRPLAGRPAAGSEGPDDAVLRGAVLTVHVCAIAGLVAAGVLPPAVAVLTAAVAVGLSLLARACLTRPSLGPLRITLWTAVAVATLVLPFVLGAARLVGTGGVATVLGLFVAGFLAATSADQDGTRRAMLMNLVLGVAVLALAVGLGPFLSPRSVPLLAGPVLVGWAAALVALARAARRVPVGAASGAAPAASSGGPSGAVPGDPVVRISGPRRVSPWRGTAGAVALTMAVSLLAFGLLSLLPSSSSGGGGGSPFDLGGPGADGQGAAASRSVTTYSGGMLDLRARGDLPDTPVMLVAADSPQLWRAAVLDTYTGQTWAQETLLGAGSRRATGTVDVRVADDPVPAGAAVRTDTVRWLAPGPFVVPRPGVASSVTLPPSDTVVIAADGTLLHPHGNGGSRNDDEVDYRVTWAARPSVEAGDGSGSTVTPDVLRAAAPGTGGLPDDPQDERWLQRSRTETEATDALAARLASGAATRYDLVRAVEDHLRATTRYTLDAPVPPEGRDAVDDFLFGSKQGFCEQYATAEVVLLRSVGVPARLAVGFSGGGVPDASTGPDAAGLRMVRGTDAHAWVEVWFPGVGWVASDPTAGAQLAPQPALERAASWLKEHAVLLVVLAVVVVGAGALVTWLVLRRRRPSVAADAAAARRLPSGGAELVAAYERLGTALDRSGGGRRPEETLAELGVRLRRGDERLRAALVDGVAVPAAGLPDPAGPDDRADPAGALAVLERLLYAPAPPPPADLRAAASALDAVTARVLAAERLPQTAGV